MVNQNCSKLDYQRHSRYKGLAKKQADRVYNTLLDMYSKNLPSEDFQNYYKELQSTYLYNKASDLYCQVLSDWVANRKEPVVHF